MDWSQFDVVGFPSMFDQNIASVSLAKLIKDVYPDVRIVFGGIDFDGEIGLEYFLTFPWIDDVVSGGNRSFLYWFTEASLEKKQIFLPEWPIGGKDRFT